MFTTIFLLLLNQVIYSVVANLVFVLVSRAQLSLFIYFMCGQGYLINITLPMQYFWTLKRPSILFHTTFFSQNKRALVSLVLCCTDWLSDFLSDRFQHVIIDGCQSGWAPVLSGVRHGSILGAHLFILFVNNIPDFLSCPQSCLGIIHWSIIAVYPLQHPI